MSRLDQVRADHTAKAVQENKRRVALGYGVCPTCDGSVERIRGIKDWFGIGPIRFKCSTCGVHEMDREY